MPRLLKNDYVQLHMPRTGGHSLAEQIGVKEMVGTIHDGPGQIPGPWKDKKIISTYRGPQSWRLSVCDYLDKNGFEDQVAHFLVTEPQNVRGNLNLDPTFKLWSDPSHRFREFILKNNFNSWYEAFTGYFVAPADKVIAMENLNVHVNKI